MLLLKVVGPRALQQAGAMSLSFLVAGVDTTCADLIAGSAPSISASQDFPGLRARQAHIRDLDGHLLEIYRPWPAV